MENTQRLIFALLLSVGFFLCSKATDENYVIKTHDFWVKSSSCSKLCERKHIITVNDQFPGPTLHAHKGDTIVVNVYNHADHNITIHWHGVRQLRNPWFDGASHITQSPILHGQNFTYKIKFTSEEGTYWWHAHDHALRATVHGAIIVYPRHGSTYPFPKPRKEVPIILGEWWKMDVVDVYREASEKGEPPMPSDALTINGQPGDLYPCSKSDTTRILVKQGMTYLLRIISAMMEQQLYFAIADHQMTLVAVDGSYTKPVATKYIMISPGQTMDVLVHANQMPCAYTIAASPLDGGMGSMDDMGHDGDMGHMGHMSMTNATTATFQYMHGSTSSMMGRLFPRLPSSNDTHSANNFTSQLRSFKVSSYERANLNHVDERMFITLSMGMMHMASMNNLSFIEPEINILKAYHSKIPNIYEKDFPNEPPRKFNYTGKSTMHEDWPVEFGTKVKVLKFGKHVEIVFQATNIMSKESHPMHLHGHSFYVVGWGYGNFNPNKDPFRYNLIDPPKQSTVVVPKGGWAAIRFIADNPGVWYLHCHFEHHHYKGMSTAIIVEDGLNVVDKLLPPP